MATLKTVLFTCVIGFATTAIVLSLLFMAARFSLEEGEATLTEHDRPTANRRGVVNTMLIATRPPAFVAQHAWEEARCSEAVRNAVHGITGRKLLKPSDAWMFGRVNKDALNLVVDRSADFVYKDGSYAESVDWDSKIEFDRLFEPYMSRGTTDRLFVLGYRFKQTQYDSHIGRAGGDINSHVVLLLGKRDGTWWGYHMYHPTGDQTAFPFRVDNLRGDMFLRDFDLTHVWEVKDSQLGTEGEGVTMEVKQALMSYPEVRPLIGGHRYLDILRVYLLGDVDQYPRIAAR